jgi:hypothetical protein
MAGHVGHEDGRGRPDHLHHFRIPAQIDRHVAHLGVLQQRHQPALVLARRGEDAGTVRQRERITHPAHQRVQDLLGTEGDGDILEDVEQT